MIQIKDYLADRLNAAFVSPDPYQHTFIEQVFPWDAYEEMLDHLPGDECYKDRQFENRMIARIEDCPSFWMDVTKQIANREVVEPIITMFDETLRKNNPGGRYMADVRLVRDFPGYKIKPHTDIKAKCITMLFYLPRDNSLVDTGTIIYEPKEKGFTSDGTRRFEFEQFEKVYQAPFVENAVFGFARSNVSFHGVEPIAAGPRDVLLLNVNAA